MTRNLRPVVGFWISKTQRAWASKFHLYAAFRVCIGCACLLLVFSQLIHAQSTSATTWTVSIVLPPKLVAGQPATLAVLGVDHRLAEGITVDLGKGQRVKTDRTGRAFFTTPTD